MLAEPVTAARAAAKERGVKLGQAARPKVASSDAGRSPSGESSWRLSVNPVALSPFFRPAPRPRAGIINIAMSPGCRTCQFAHACMSGRDSRGDVGVASG
jgi:hypothetical protein